LADPKFRGQLVLESRGYPFNNFAPFWGMDRVLTLTNSYKAVQPIFKRGSAAVAAAVSTGEGSIGVTTIGNIEFDKSKGIPVDWVTPDEIPIAIEHAVVPKGAPHINTARLWAAWLTTEGRPMYEQLEKNGLAWPEEDSYLGKRLAQQGTKFSFVETEEQGQITLDALKQISDGYLAQ
jgi:spermidine/putrescine-binding protein